MKEIIENSWNMIKLVFSWLGTILIFSSFVLNFWFAGIIQMNNAAIKENGDYLKYRDSIQLELMDRITDKNNTVRK
jgi:hypothetical protein